MSLIIVTEPLRASARPWTTTPARMLIDCRAKMLPTKFEPPFKVAELPTCQKTLHSWAPLIMFTTLPVAAVSVESVWKMNTVLALPATVERQRARQQAAGSCSGPRTRRLAA